MSGQIEGPVMKRRTRRASKLADELIRERLTYHEGETVEVLVTEVGKVGTSTLMGRDPRYNPVVIADGEKGGPAIGQVVTVRLVRAEGVYIVGEVVD
jgi:tRNA A37 methylthiotransferase MiaB